MSGTGKSSALHRLAQRGHQVVDTDSDRWCRWDTAEDGRPDWVWREDALTELLAGHREGKLFVAGCKSNQKEFYPWFDHVALLTAPEHVILDRIERRATNTYGKRADERELILRDLVEVEPLLRRSATVEIDASARLEDVVDRLDALG
jgi:dephospho-CoA kinase